MIHIGITAIFYIVPHILQEQKQVDNWLLSYFLASCVGLCILNSCRKITKGLELSLGVEFVFGVLLFSLNMKTRPLPMQVRQAPISFHFSCQTDQEHSLGCMFQQGNDPKDAVEATKKFLRAKSGKVECS